MADLPHIATGDPHVAAHNAERDQINVNNAGIAARIVSPATPQTGELLRWDGTVWARTGVRLLEGNGTPETHVAAPPGSRYVQLDGGGGAVEYIKRTGTGNTGWVLSQLADTGWRNVLGTVDLNPGAQKFAANIRRFGNVVNAYFDLETPNANGSWAFYVLPAGFRPDFTMYGALQDNKESAATTTTVSSGGQCTMATIKGSWRDRWNGTWLTNDGWPSTLPGSALT